MEMSDQVNHQTRNSGSIGEKHLPELVILVRILLMFSLFGYIIFGIERLIGAILLLLFFQNQLTYQQKWR